MSSLDLQPLLQPVHECLGEWSTEQESLERDVLESVVALEGFQRSLEAWRQTLVEERQALADDRAAWEAEQHNSGDLRDEVDLLSGELAEARSTIERLETSLEAKRAELAEQQDRWDEDFRHMRELLNQQAELFNPPAQPSAAPVESQPPAIDSVLAQFGKLRKEQAARRSEGPPD